MTLAVPDAGERDALADVVARAVRLDPAVAVRLRSGSGRVAMWATTPFDVLVTASVVGGVDPVDVTVMGSDLLAALSVVATPVLELGLAVDDRWRGAVPDVDRWRPVGEIADAEALAAEGVRAAAETGPSAALFDATACEVGQASAATGERREASAATGESQSLRIPMRCLLALAGMGWPTDGAPVEVALSGDGAWMRLGDDGGAIVRHRRPRLSLTAT